MEEVTLLSLVMRYESHTHQPVLSLFDDQLWVCVAKVGFVTPKRIFRNRVFRNYRQAYVGQRVDA